MTGTSTSSTSSSSWSTPCPQSPNNNNNNDVTNNNNNDNTNQLFTVPGITSINSDDYEIVDAALSRLFENEDEASELSRELPEPEEPEKVSVPSSNPVQWPFYILPQPTYFVHQPYQISRIAPIQIYYFWLNRSFKFEVAISKFLLRRPGRFRPYCGRMTEIKTSLYFNPLPQLRRRLKDRILKYL